MATIETDTENPERLVKRFIGRFRQPDAYQRLAAHAALPLVLTPELLHYLRNAFLRGEVPWVAEADLLLSDLCEEVGYEQYVMSPAVRDRLVADLKQTYGEGRLKEVARLIWQYLLRVERTAPALGCDALQAQQWSAMAYLDSERVARENAEKIKAALARPQDRDALASLAKITETLAPQLQGFPALVEYARQLSRLLSGETETTTGPGPPTTGQTGGPNVVVGGVELPPIKDVAEALNPKLSDVAEAEERVRGDLPIQGPDMSVKPTQPRLKVAGAVDSRRDVYIIRPSDNEVFDLLKRGEYCTVFCSRQMGKTSLMHRAKMRLAEAGVKTALIDVAGYLGSVPTESADTWYRGLLQEIADQLGLDLNVARWWQTRTSATPDRRLIAFFRDEVAAKAGAPVVVILDEIDSMLKRPYTNDLFVALRAMYNDRPREAAFEQVAFCLAGVATPNELIKDQHTSPYNVSWTIELSDFDPARDDLSPLFRAVSNKPQTGAALVHRVLLWTGGHPYLTMRLCNEVVKEGAATVEDVDRLVDKLYRNLDAVRSDVHFATILRFFESGRVDDLITTLMLYRRIWRGQQEHDLTTPVHIQLKLTGIVKRDDYGRLVVRNRIYQQIFTEDWAMKTAMVARRNVFTRGSPDGER